MSLYCDFARGHPLHGPYHDREYGRPITDETALFERLSLEIMQAGLSWELVLKKREGLRAAYAGFSPDRVASFSARDRARLMADPGVIRNRLKIEATIANAAAVVAMRQRDGGFAAWLAAQHPLRKPDWVRRLKTRFRFVGGEIAGEFLKSLGYLPGAHGADCPVHRSILRQTKPPWIDVGADWYSQQ
ncbi:MAG: DNA-3-methyladenine glycosylase I [Alphaproteobacteria bacterium]|nr:DNA-3-methyladenine glycosylase I [Alphaproteobacteria bacterium]